MASISLQAAYDQARQSLESNDLDRAIGLAQHILDHYPDNLEAYRILGEAYLANRQLDRAQESFERVLRSDPENIPAHVGLGITAERQGKLDRAIVEFEQALEIKPDMTELRSQLLRLYSEGFGSENAQLRLSRAGLARLYAKGHMLPQAISEFRQVINDQPGRFDAMVALAEALWRDGQEDEAIELCRDILAERPESLKANLLLGYLLLSSGRPEGDRPWQAALRMDPYQGVARALFETLPQEQDEQPTIDEWDEAAWRSRRAAEQQEQIAATRPMESITPVGTPTDATAILGSARRERPAVQAPATPISRPQPAETDNFLASLLALDNAPPLPSSSSAPVSDEELGLDANMQPFSFDDLTGAQPLATPPAPADEPAMTPFSLSDLGLSDDEIASMNDLGAPSGAAAAPAEPAADDDIKMTPFSLSDLGLSDDEIASMNDLGAPSGAAAAPAEPAADDDIKMTPFSLSDLGLSDDEIASMNDLGAPSGAAAAPAEPAADDDINMAPFSLSDLGLSDDEIASMNDLGAPSGAAAAPAEPAADDDINMAPFSLSDLGLSDDEIAGLDSLQSPSDASPTSKNASRQSFGDAAEQSEFDETSDLPIDLQPFSFDDLDLDADSGSSAGSGGLPSSLQPFSLEDAAPARPRVSGFGSAESLENDESADDEDVAAEPRGFSWQQASQKPEPSFSKPPRQDPPSGDLSIFSKLKHHHESQDPRPDEPLPPVPIEPDEHLGLFSLDDISLRDDFEDKPAATTTPETQPRAATPPPEIDNLEDALASGQVQPFSFADLGLSDEEIAAMGIGDVTPVAPESPAAASKPPEIDNLQDALASGQVQPFSFADLGLSEEELAALEDSMSAGTAGAPSDSSPGNVSAAKPEIENLEDALASGQVQPFSLSDLGLSDEEIAAMGMSDTANPAGTPASASANLPEAGSQLDEFDVDLPSSAESAAADAAASEDEESSLVNGIQPFSLTDLGLSDDEIEEFGFDSNLNAAVEEGGDVGLGLTEEELEGLDGGNLHWSQPAANTPAVPPSAGYAEPQVTSGDLVVDRLIALGRQQGYIDISDIIANFEDPESEAVRIEEIGMRLHDASIEIRDGDEVIDMDAEYAEEQADEAPTVPEQPAPRPSYPTRDLDLVSDDLETPDVESAAPSADEPNMTPFSLSDLGLSEEEIAALDLGEPAATAEPASAPVAESSPAASVPGEAQPSEQDTSSSLLNHPAEQSEQAAPATTASEPAVEPAAKPERVAPAAAPVATQVSANEESRAGSEMLDTFIQQLEAEPDNDILRLSFARIGSQIGRVDLSIQQYKYLIKHNRLLNDVVVELQDLIADSDDRQELQRLHRALGDAYARQGRFREAIDEYSWTLGGPRGVH